MREQKGRRPIIDVARHLDSEDPLERLSAVGRLRGLLDEAETDAVGQARDAVARYSWDQIAKALGMTRWSVLRRFGPHGNHPAIEKAGEPAADRPSQGLPAVTQVPAGAPTVPQLPGSLPQEIGDRVIYLVGELVTESIRDGRLSMKRPAEVRIEVLSGAIRVDVSRWGPPNSGLLEANADRWGDREGNPPGVWFELDLRPSADVGQ